VLGKLSITQLVKLASYFGTINYRKTLMYAPKGNWSRVQIVPNEKIKIDPVDLHALHDLISTELSNRLNIMYPEGVDLDPRLVGVKLQTNDQKLAEYGRGTEFDIPENITFIRSASYWEETRSYGNTWFDNGWNFFDENWNNRGVCAWTDVALGKGAIFSGDPTNSKDMKGRGCQMIDLYIDKLVAMGIRYAVWNVLCYSGIPFDEAGDVLATLQMGETALTGKLSEPGRAQMVFPLKGKAKTKYVAYIDLVKRKLVYMDADFRGSTHSANMNGAALSVTMPAYCEYLNSLPSVADIFINARIGTTPILYSDEDTSITEGKAYVFKPLNPDNKFQKISLADVA